MSLEILTRESGVKTLESSVTSQIEITDMTNHGR
jgi:hypothetical protein